MRVPLSWLRDWVDLPDRVDGRTVADALVRVGLEVQTVDRVGADVSGPLVVGRVLAIEQLTGFKKPIRYCQVDVGEPAPRGIVCGAANFAAGDRVVVALPGAVLPGGLAIGARSTYGRVSDGMICSVRELGIGAEHDGILVLTEPGEVGADAIDLLGLREDVLDIAVTADRGYCLSVRGVAREAAAAFGVALRDPADVAVPEPAGPGWTVRLADPDGCDGYVARTVSGLDPAARSPLWLQRRLALAGMRPISLAVDITNHVMLELGQPLHAFDRSRLSGPIVVRRARPGERLVTLDWVDRALDPEDLLITDDTGPIALAGVMGGASTEIGAGSTDVLVEAAHFDAVTAARCARRHRLPSEASRRFERGVDPAVAPAAAQRAVEMLVRLGGATADPAATAARASQAAPAPITVRWELAGTVTGVGYPRATVVRRLHQVGCTVTGEGDVITVSPPTWRPDLTEPYDLVEEVARLEGYDAIPSALPPVPPGRGLTGGQRLRRRVSRALAADGFVEVSAYPFLAASVWDDLGAPADDPRRRMLRLANPLSEAEPYLRTSLLPGLLAVLRRNVGRGSTDLALSETGAVFLPRMSAAGAPRPQVRARPSDAELAALDDALPDQPLRVAVVLTGARAPAGWWGGGRAAGWADAVQAARTAGDAVGVPVEVTAGQQAPWHPGRCAQLRVGDVGIGYGGELHPRVVAALRLPPRTCAMELDLAPVLAAAADVVAAPAVSPYPPAAFDVALVVAADVPAARVQAALQAGGGPLVESVRLFDVYAGDQVPAGHRSLAYAVRLRAADRTLTGEEAMAVRDAAVDQAGRQVGAVLRGA